MNKRSEKKGLLELLKGSLNPKQSSCCGGFELEEIPEENAARTKKAEAPKSSCCGGFEIEEIPEEGAASKEK